MHMKKDKIYIYNKNWRLLAFSFIDNDRRFNHCQIIFPTISKTQ